MRQTNSSIHAPRRAVLIAAVCGLALVATAAASARPRNRAARSQGALTPPAGASAARARGSIVVRRAGNDPARDTLVLDLSGLHRNGRYTVTCADPATPGGGLTTLAVVRTGRSRHGHALLGGRGRLDLPPGTSLDDLAGTRIEVRDERGTLVLAGSVPSLEYPVGAAPAACRLIEDVVLADDFDAATTGAAPPDWDVTGTDVPGIEVAVDGTVFDGASGASVKLADTVAADPGAPSMARSFAAQNGYFAIEFTLVADTSAARAVCRVSDSSASPAAVPSGLGDGLGFYEDGTIGFAIGDSLGSVAAGSSHRVRIDFDLGTKTFDVSVDGAQLVSGRDLGFAGAALDRIEFAGAPLTTGTAWVDSVRVIHQTPDCPPAANAGPDQLVECAGATTPVTLDGTDSADPEGAALTYTWSGDFVEGVADGATPTVHFAGHGPHTARLVVNDGFFDSPADEVAIEVADTAPPVLTVGNLPTELWPPNHQMITIAPSVAATDLCDGDQVQVTLAITSNERDDGLGDGSTTGDWVIRTPSDFDLRAERSGPGSGRTYTLVWTVVDAAGNRTTKEARVVVPHDRGHGRR